MTDENTETKASPAPVAQAQATATPPATGGGTAKPDGKVAHADTGKASDGEGDAKQGGGVHTIEVGDDEYEVDEKGFVKIPATAFKKRLNRYSKAQLKAAFGTDDLDDLKKRLDEHGTLKAQSEEQRRKQLAKEEQLAEDLKKAKEQAAQAEERANRLAEEREFREADQEVRTTAERYIKPGKLSKLAVYEFGEYVRDMDEEDAKKMRSKDMDAWFKKYAEENPEFAVKAGGKDGKEKDGRKAERRPMEHGAGDAGNAPHAASAAAGGKTAKPGQTNSMSDKEYREFKRQQGLG